MSQKSIVQAEDPCSERFELNVTLVNFYADRGIEFLGETTFGGPIFRPGARWRIPDAFPSLPENSEAIRKTSNGISLLAARSLLGLPRTAISDAVNVPRNTIAAVEGGRGWSETHDTLRSYYNSRQIDFLGWGKVEQDGYYGVGVRWQAFELILEPSEVTG